MSEGWAGRGKVRARWRGETLELQVDGVTTQARYYKPLIYEFFRKDFPVRPRFGDFSVEILLEHQGDPPGLDLDNLAKALLDALKRFVFVDDVQIARLLVERRAGERERISVQVAPLGPGRAQDL